MEEASSEATVLVSSFLAPGPRHGAKIPSPLFPNKNAPAGVLARGSYREGDELEKQWTFTRQTDESHSRWSRKRDSLVMPLGPSPRTALACGKSGTV